MTMTPCTAFRGKADVCVKSESYVCLKIYRERERQTYTHQALKDGGVLL
jgi:hypothetical protein